MPKKKGGLKSLCVQKLVRKLLNSSLMVFKQLQYFTWHDYYIFFFPSQSFITLIIFYLFIFKFNLILFYFSLEFYCLVKSLSCWRGQIFGRFV